MTSIGDVATGRNIISVAEVQNYLNTTDASITGFIQQCISNVSSFFENDCGKGFKFNPYSGIYDYERNNTNNNRLYTAQYPIISVSSLQYRLCPTSEWIDFYEPSLSANILIYENYVEIFDKTFPAGKQNIKIDYVAGYIDCPGDLKQVAIENVVKILYESSISGVGKGFLGLKSLTNGNENYTFADLIERTENVLNKYRRII